MNDSKPPVCPRPWRIQFSLKLLLVAFTAFAIGFPIWYRWPYEEVEDVSPTSKTKRVITWQRQWGGSRIKHGRERVATNLGTFDAVETTTYRNGQKHGAYQFDLGPDGLKGQY